MPEKDGRTDMEALKASLGADAACFYLQQPNYYGNMEDATAIGGRQPHRLRRDGYPG